MQRRDFIKLGGAATALGAAGVSSALLTGSAAASSEVSFTSKPVSVTNQDGDLSRLTLDPEFTLEWSGFDDSVSSIYMLIEARAAGGNFSPIYEERLDLLPGSQPFSGAPGMTGELSIDDEDALSGVLSAREMDPDAYRGRSAFVDEILPADRESGDEAFHLFTNSGPVTVFRLEIDESVYGSWPDNPNSYAAEVTVDIDSDGLSGYQDDLRFGYAGAASRENDQYHDETGAGGYIRQLNDDGSRSDFAEEQVTGFEAFEDPDQQGYFIVVNWDDLANANDGLTSNQDGTAFRVEEVPTRFQVQESFISDGGNGIGSVSGVSGAADAGGVIEVDEDDLLTVANESGRPDYEAVLSQSELRAYLGGNNIGFYTGDQQVGPITKTKTQIPGLVNGAYGAAFSAGTFDNGADGTSSTGTVDLRYTLELLRPSLGWFEKVTGIDVVEVAKARGQNLFSNGNPKPDAVLSVLEDLYDSDDERWDAAGVSDVPSLEHTDFLNETFAPSDITLEETSLQFGFQDSQYEPPMNGEDGFADVATAADGKFSRTTRDRQQLQAAAENHPGIVVSTTNYEVEVTNMTATSTGDNDGDSTTSGGSSGTGAE
jgi:hypothetical protein